IRHKLMMGLALVVGIIALLLVGTLKGLASYRDTCNSIDSNLQELYKAQQLTGALIGLSGTVSESESEAGFNPTKLRARAEEAHRAFKEYQETLRETILRGRGPDDDSNVIRVTQTLHERFQDLDEKIARATAPIVDEGDGKAISDPRMALRGAIVTLLRYADE